MVGKYIDAIFFKLLHHRSGDFRILPGHDPRCHIHLGYLGTKITKGLGQLAANWPTTHYQQTLR